MYKVNDVVVYRRDVCRIIGKQRSDFTGEQCFILVPYANCDGTVRMQVPVSNKAGHLRQLVTKEQIEELMVQAAAVETLENKPANMKSQYAALLKSDSILDLIRIIKTSYTRNQERLDQHKKLATVDDDYLQRAEKYLFEEFSVALGMPFAECREYFLDGIRKVQEEQ